MVRRDAAFLKNERIKTIERTMLQAVAKGIDLEKLLKEIEYSMGLTQETALRYVQTIVDHQGWLIIDGVVRASLSEEVEQDAEKG